MRVKRPLACSWAVLFTCADKHSIWASLSLSSFIHCSLCKMLDPQGSDPKKLVRSFAQVWICLSEWWSMPFIIVFPLLVLKKKTFVYFTFFSDCSTFNLLHSTPLYTGTFVSVNLNLLFQMMLHRSIVVFLFLVLEKKICFIPPFLASNSNPHGDQFMNLILPRTTLLSLIPFGWVDSQENIEMWKVNDDVRQSTDDGPWTPNETKTVMTFGQTSQSCLLKNYRP